MNLNNLRLNLQQYTTLKNQNLISFISDGKSVFISQKQFDLNTGLPLPDLVTQIAIVDIQNKINDLQSTIDNLNTMLGDTNIAIVTAQQAKGVLQP